ncbi:hypothetical protein, partial [Pseudomonas marginalis]|uniref:hypothetical protein n=1 Tax=Pseudomonas marginalis TaxID=298 RepID=UPI0034D3F9D8
VYFLSRSQTWIPFAVFCIGALVGFLNDYYDVVHQGQGIKLSLRLLIIATLSATIGWWFYSKLGVTSIGVPFDGQLE